MSDLSLVWGVLGNMSALVSLVPGLCSMSVSVCLVSVVVLQSIGVLVYFVFQSLVNVCSPASVCQSLSVGVCSLPVSESQSCLCLFYVS